MRYSICWIAASVELLLLGGAGRGGKASVRRARADSRLRAGFTGRLHGATSQGWLTVQIQHSSQWPMQGRREARRREGRRDRPRDLQRVGWLLGLLKSRRPQKQSSHSSITASGGRAKRASRGLISVRFAVFAVSAVFSVSNSIKLYLIFFPYIK